MKITQISLLCLPLAIVCFSWQRTVADDPGPVAHWKLDGTSRALDSAGDHHGTSHGADLGQDGAVLKACRFNSREDDWIDAGDGLQLDRVKRLTVSAFVRPDSFNPADFRNRANSRNGVLGSDDANFIFALTDRGRPTFIWDAADNKYQQIITDPNDAVPLDQWSHVAVTRDGPTMTLYINGVLKKAESRFAEGNFVRFGRMCLGRVNGSAARDFDGLIDDVRVYDRALTADEIWELAAAGGLAGTELPRPQFGSRSLERLEYNNPGLAVDLGVGLWAWPLPMDYDGDGDLDLVVSCHDVPFRATCFFENPGGDQKMPVFKPGKVIGRGVPNVQVSYAGDQIRVLIPGEEYVDFIENVFDKPAKLPVSPNVHPNRVRANQWRYVDYDGDGLVDLTVGVGDWTEYGWDNAFNAQGEWTRGPLHGYVYLLRNTGTNDQPAYSEPSKIDANGSPIDVYGMPSPNLADFDGDGDLDILCGEFVDKLTYFENIGTRTKPQYAAGRFLMHGGEPLRMSLCMIVPTAVDWDRDGDVDLVVGQEDGRVAFVEHTGQVVDGLPQFASPHFFQQEADEVKFGALVTPVGFDWDGDEDEDLVCGNTEGHIGFIENLDGGCPPKWAAPRLIEADGRAIRIEAGPNGSIQGPCEAKWGYTTLSVADWDHDDLPDLVVNSIWGKVIWYRNIGTRQRPALAAPQAIEVQWPDAPPKPAWNWWNPVGKELATQWRTTPVVTDFNQDALNDLVMLDHEGFLAFFERKRVNGRLVLMPPNRAFREKSGTIYGSRHNPEGNWDGPLQLNNGQAGRSGRHKLCCVDWDGDGGLDFLVNSRSVDFLRRAGTQGGLHLLEDKGPVDSRPLAGHTTSPTIVDWDKNGVPDLVVGAEDGYLYYLRNPHPRIVDGKPRPF